jgi:hypothetical protein
MRLFRAVKDTRARVLLRITCYFAGFAIRLGCVQGERSFGIDSRMIKEPEGGVDVSWCLPDFRIKKLSRVKFQIGPT